MKDTVSVLTAKVYLTCLPRSEEKHQSVQRKRFAKNKSSKLTNCQLSVVSFLNVTLMVPLKQSSAMPLLDNAGAWTLMAVSGLVLGHVAIILIVPNQYVLVVSANYSVTQ